MIEYNDFAEADKWYTLRITEAIVTERLNGNIMLCVSGQASVDGKIKRFRQIYTVSTNSNMPVLSGVMNKIIDKLKLNCTIAELFSPQGCHVLEGKYISAIPKIDGEYVKWTIGKVLDPANNKMDKSIISNFYKNLSLDAHVMIDILQKTKETD